MPAAVPIAWLNALSDTHLKSLASPVVAERAQAYLAQVRDIRLAPVKSHEAIAADATIHGTHPYQTRVGITIHHKLHGQCSCPHAQDGYFCKHQVALSITLRHMLNGQPMPWLDAAEPQEGTPTEPQGLASRAFLMGQTHEVLVDRLWQWAQAIPPLMMALELWAQQTQAPPQGQPDAIGAQLPVIGKLKRQITDTVERACINPRTHWSRRDYTPDSASEIEEIVDLLTSFLLDQPVVVRELFEHAWTAIGWCWEDMYDEEGELTEVCASLVNLLNESLQAAPPPAAWFDTWMRLMDSDPVDAWVETQTLAVVGPAVQARYIDRATRDWAKWQDELRVHGKSALDRSVVRERYLNSLALQGDVQAQIDVMSHDLSTAAEHLTLVDLLEKHGRLREAMDRLEEAYRAYPDHLTLQNRLLVCYERDGCDDDALRLRRQQLAIQPSPHHYIATLRAAVTAGHDENTYRAELHAWALTQEQNPLHTRRITPHMRAHWWLSEGQPLQALPLVEPLSACSFLLLAPLAQALPESHWGDAVRLLRHLFERDMLNAKSPYAQVLCWVKEAAQRMPEAERLLWLQQLRLTYKAKRNFIQGLQNMR